VQIIKLLIFILVFLPVFHSKHVFRGPFAAGTVCTSTLQVTPYFFLSHLPTLLCLGTGCGQWLYWSFVSEPVTSLHCFSVNQMCSGYPHTIWNFVCERDEKGHVSGYIIEWNYPTHRWVWIWSVLFVRAFRYTGKKWIVQWCGWSCTITLLEGVLDSLASTGTVFCLWVVGLFVYLGVSSTWMSDT
jgi:hypothetical protein